jgi:hypothetical protein
VTWDEAYNSKVQHMPAIVTNETEAPVKPDADGWYPIATPGWAKKDYEANGKQFAEVI